MKNVAFFKTDDMVEAFTIGKNAELPYYVIQPHQVHGDNIKVVDRRDMTRSELEGVDAILTNLTNCPIAVRTADCVPILLYDPITISVAAIHSGWRGTVKKIVKKVVEEMKGQYGTDPQNIHAIIGPSIGPNAFFVHDDVVEAFRKAGYPMDLISREKDEGSYLINLWYANKWLLEKIGLKPENIQISSICTYTHHNEFYSARHEKNNKCGRNINVIRIKGKCEASRHQKVG